MTTTGIAATVLSDLVTARQLAARWNCFVGHLANLRSAGLGPVYLKIGTAVRYRVTDLLAYEEAHAVDSVTLSTGSRRRP